jgi:hypothetical protein
MPKGKGYSEKDKKVNVREMTRKHEVGKSKDAGKKQKEPEDKGMVKK